MPRSFELSADYDVSVAQVRAAFGDEAYWLARLADSGADTATLDSMSTDADGRTEVSTTQAVSRDRLPGLVAQLHRGDLTIVRGERWGPVRDGAARGHVTGKVSTAPASLSGEAVLAPSPTGCRLQAAATVHVDIALVGGKIEDIIGAKLAELMTHEQRFTSSWIAEPGRGGLRW